MATKQEIQQSLDRLIDKADPAIAKELREIKRQISESKEVGVSVISVSRRVSQLNKERRTHHVLKKILIEDNDNYTVEEVAELFGVTRQAVHKWINTDRIKYIAPLNGKRKGYLIPKNQFKPRRSRGEQFRRRRNEIFGEDALSLENSQEVFRSGEVEE